MRKVGLIAFALLVIPSLTNCNAPKNFKITFDANGGYFGADKTCTQKTITVKQGSLPIFSETPQKDAKTSNSALKYTFTEWSPKIEKVTKDATYLANYKEDEYFVVTFETHLGTDIEPQLVKPGETVVPPKKPERGADVFTGWNIYNEVEQKWEEFDFDTPITKDITLSAAYDDYVLVFYNSTGGSYVKPQLVKRNVGFTPPKIPPTKTGHGFASWQKWNATKSEYEDFNFEDGTEGNIILFAKWNKGKFKLTFESKNDYVDISYNGGPLPEDFEYSETPYVFKVTLDNSKIPAEVKGKLETYGEKIVLPRMVHFKTGDGVYPGVHKYIRSDDETASIELDMQADVYIYVQTEAKKPLTACPWEDISAIANLGYADELFNVGDTKNITLYSYYTPAVKQEIQHQVRIIDFDHDELATSTNENPEYANITFEFANLMTEDDPYRHETGYVVVWCEWNFEKELESDNYDYINHSYINWAINPCDDERGDGKFYKDMYPDEFMIGTGTADIKQVKKIVGVNNDPPPVHTSNQPHYIYEPTAFNTYFFLLSTAEMTERHLPSTPEGEGTTYKYYQGEGDTNVNRIKHLAIGNGENNSVFNNYWTRTPSTDPEFPPPNQAIFTINNSGKFINDSCCTDAGISFAPAFCI